MLLFFYWSTAKPQAKKMQRQKSTKGVGGNLPHPPQNTVVLCCAPIYVWKKKTAASRAGALGPWGLYTWHLKLGSFAAASLQAAAPKFAQVPKTKSVDFV